MSKISCNQYGFWRGRSTTDCLAFVTHQIGSYLDKSKTVAAVSFDIKKAFDTVAFGRVLSVFRDDFSVPDYLLRWLHSYLTNRTYCVRVGSCHSDSRAVLSGVPQGSRLGPWLFLAVINSVCSLNFSEMAKVALFADDVFFMKTIRNVRDEQAVQSDIVLLAAHVSDIGLSFSAAKTQVTLFSYNRVSPPTLSTDLVLEGEVLTAKPTIRYLGIILDSRLTFLDQSRAAVTKARRAVGALSRQFRQAAPPHVLAKVYNTCILPAMLYGAEIWFPSSVAVRCQIEKVQRFMLRLLQNDFDSSYNVLLEQSGKLPVWKIVHIRRMIAFYKLYHGLHYVPSDCLPRNTNRRSAKNYCLYYISCLNF